MSAQTKIEWCDATFNPWIGCTKVSPGCTNCYAEGESKRRGWAEWGKGKERHRTSANYWKQPIKWNAEKLFTRRIGYMDVPTRRRVFCGSLCDWLDDEVPIQWLADLLALIHATPNLDWLLLTKRPENWRARIEGALNHEARTYASGDSERVFFCSYWLDGAAPENVWFGVSVEDQKRADERIPILLNQIPARIRFLSCEPLLGEVHLLTAWTLGPRHSESQFHSKPFSPLHGIDWVICGGESGRNARPMHPDWARSLRDQCNAAGIPFFFKQWGEWVSWDAVSTRYDLEGLNLKNFRQSSIGDVGIARLSKKRAGRLLDGREWNEFPQRDVVSISKAEATA